MRATPGVGQMAAKSAILKVMIGRYMIKHNINRSTFCANRIPCDYSVREQGVVRKIADCTRFNYFNNKISPLSFCHAHFGKCSRVGVVIL